MGSAVQGAAGFYGRLHPAAAARPAIPDTPSCHPLPKIVFFSTPPTPFQKRLPPNRFASPGKIRGREAAKRGPRERSSRGPLSL
ncbi:hypothetical protein HMPREF0262_00194 [Clostridium sp. ATCC 29733]|nr:hypothetical protein HMPREF0262_00194 [Clostridium sp. ATCC 29733]